MIGLLKTKVKDKNVNKVAEKTIPGWLWQHNFEHDAKRLYLDCLETQLIQCISSSEDRPTCTLLCNSA